MKKMNTSINRDSITEPLIVNQKSDNRLTQRFLRQTTTAASKDQDENELLLADKNGQPEAVAVKKDWDELTDLKSNVLSNFMSKPTQFKITRDQSKILVIIQDKDNKDKQIKKATLKVYSLPDFGNELGSFDLPLEETKDGIIWYKYMEISDDNQFIVFGHKNKLIIQTASSLFPQVFEDDEEEKFERTEINLEKITGNCGVRFTEKNELIFVEVTENQVIVKQTNQLSKKDDFSINLNEECKIDSRTQKSSEDDKSQFNLILFNSCIYIRYYDALYSFRPLSTISSQNQRNSILPLSTGNFWDPIKGVALANYNSVGSSKTLSSSMMNGGMSNQQNLVSTNDAFSKVLSCFVQDDVFLIQQTEGVVVMYQQKIGQIKGLIVEQKRLKLSDFYTNGEQMEAFKFYQGNLYVKNDSISRLDVLSFRDGQFQKLWYYQYEQTYIVESVHQLQSSHFIHILEKENKKDLNQINGYENQLLFNHVWQNLRAKFTMIADDQLFQDGENDGSLIILSKNGRQQIQTIKDSKPGMSLNRYKNFIKNIYYSEELSKLVLLKSFEASTIKKEEIYFMSTIQSDNYQVSPLIKEFQDQNVTIIGTMYESKREDIVLLFALIESQNLVMFRIDKHILKIKKNDNKDYITIFEKENIKKEEIYLEKKNKIIIAKFPDNTDYKIIFKFEEYSKLNDQQKLPTFTKETGRLIKVENTKLYFLNNKDKTIVIYDIDKDGEKCDKQKDNTKPMQIKTANFQILWDAAAKTKLNQRENEQKNDRLIQTENFLICQNETKIYIFDSKTFDLKCQINNAPLDCGFLRTKDGQFYLIVKSSIDGLINVMTFNLLNDKKLLSLNQKEQLQTYIRSQNPLKIDTNDKEIQELYNNWSIIKDQKNNIPKEFQLSLDTFIIFDFFESRVELYDSADSLNLKVWSNLNSRSQIQKQLLGNTNKKVIMDYFLKKSQDYSSAYNIQECLFFDTLHKRSVLHLVIENSQVFTAIIDRLLTMKEEELPYLMFEDENQETPLDIAIRKQQVKNVVYLLKLIVFHKSAAEQYNKHIDKHLIKLIQMELNLKDLFQSEILFHPIQYPSQENNKANYLYPAVYEFKKDIEGAYHLIVNDKNQLLLKEETLLDELELKIENQKKEVQQFSVDYNLIDMKNTLKFGFENGADDQDTLMEVLNKQTRQDIFEFPCIQRIIDYKWLTYTKAHFLLQFKWFLALLILFYASLYMQQTIAEEDLTQETLVVAGYDFKESVLGTPARLANLILTTCYGLIACKFILIEIQSIKKTDFKDYITDIWNMNDIVLFSLLLVQGTFSILQVVEMQSNFMKIVKIFVIFQFFIKLNFFLRIFETFSFLVSMLQDVFSDLSSFFAFFMMTLATFGCFIQVLLPEANDSYEGASFFGYMMMAFRTSTGDYTFDNYKATALKELAWVIWLAIMIIGNIVFMNFIIAVVNDSYRQSMAKKISQSYRLKVPLIVEREKLLDQGLHINEVQAKRMKEIMLEASRVKKIVEDTNNKKEDHKKLINENSELSEMQIFVPNFIVVRTSSTANENVNDPLTFQIQVQNAITELQRNQNEQANEFREQFTKIINMMNQNNGNSPMNLICAEDGNSPVIKTQQTRRL